MLLLWSNLFNFLDHWFLQWVMDGWTKAVLYCFIAQPCKLWKHEPPRMDFIFRNITIVKSSGNDFCLVSNKMSAENWLWAFFFFFTKECIFNHNWQCNNWLFELSGYTSLIRIKTVFTLSPYTREQTLQN